MAQAHKHHYQGNRMNDQTSLPMAQAIKAMRIMGRTIDRLEAELDAAIRSGLKQALRAEELQEIAKSEHDACVATTREAHNLRAERDGLLDVIRMAVIANKNENVSPIMGHVHKNNTQDILQAALEKNATE